MRAPRVVISVVGVGCPRRRSNLVRIGRVIKPVWNARDHPLLRTIRIQRADYVAARVVEHCNLLALVKKRVSRIGIRPSLCEERLVLLDDPTLVVIDLPAADHNVRISRTGISPSNHSAACATTLFGWQHALTAAENLFAKSHVIALSARLEQAPETIRILVALNRRIQLRLRDGGVSLRVVINLAGGVNEDRLTAIGVGQEVIL